MSKDQQDLPTVKLWEFGLFLPTFAILCWAIYERHEIFEDAVRDYSSGHSFLLLCWTVPVFFVLLFSRPWKLRSKFGSTLTMFGLVVCSFSFAFIFSGHYPPYRTRVVKFELERWPLGIAFGSERPARSLTEHLLDWDTGPELLQKRSLLEMIAKDHGRGLLAEDNRATALVWLSLIKQGATFEQLWEKDELKKFFLACWQAQAESVTLRKKEDVWSALDWSEPYVAQQSRLLNPQQTDIVARYFYHLRDELDATELQVVLQSAFLDVGRFDQTQIDELLEVWKKQIQEHAPDLATTLEQRQSLRQFLGDSRQVKLAVRVGKWDQSTYNVLSDSVPKTLDSMISADFGSCGTSVQWADWDDAEIRLQIELEQSDDYNYSHDTQTGAISLTLENSKDTLQFEKVPYYWSESSYGYKAYRIWPFGFDKRLLDREQRYIW